MYYAYNIDKYKGNLITGYNYLYMNNNYYINLHEI